MFIVFIFWVLGVMIFKKGSIVFLYGMVILKLWYVLFFNFLINGFILLMWFILNNL